MRQYQLIWWKLKTLSRHDAETKGISVTAPRPLHRRIIKAVKKEKWMDMSYKLILQETEQRTAVLHTVQRNSILTFLLSFTLTPEDF